MNTAKLQQSNSKKRFPYLITVGITPELMAALEAGTANGLFTVSDTARLALYSWACSQGFIQPQGPQHVNGNGGGNVASR